MAKYKMLKPYIWYEEKSRERHNYTTGQILDNPPAELLNLFAQEALPIAEKVGIGKIGKDESKSGAQKKKKK